MAEDREDVVLPLAPFDDPVEPVLAFHEVADDAAGDVGVTGGHRRLAEVAELVGQHRLELAQVHAVHEAQADEQVFLRLDEQVDERGPRHARRVHVRRDEHLVRFGRAEFVAELVDELEEDRVFVLRDLDVHLLVHRGPLKEALDQVQEEGAAQDQADDLDGRVLANVEAKHQTPTMAKRMTAPM